MPRNSTAQAAGRLRIIGGKWRSRQLPVIAQPGLRPTPDRVRETLFNWLQAVVPGARCLDLFAGSGALGIEAASRGAAEVLLIEQQADACKMLTKNVQALAASNIEIQQQDALQWLQRGNARAAAYDLVFIDPPYDSPLLPAACQLLEANNWLADEACIYFELASNQVLPELPANWEIIRGKKAGQVSYHLVKRSQAGDA
ncbi:MAG: 16S rRNA (guanine(966)-N(2))-methyltransferase RsmD [Gammaproteobacteria bacterium]|nr:16S rRNA (guanine(966)-N(2))-methyltransferase RsmD [Gammaproteobacteria bacterium]